MLFFYQSCLISAQPFSDIVRIISALVDVHLGKLVSQILVQED